MESLGWRGGKILKTAAARAVLQDVARQVFVFGQLAEVLINIGGVDVNAAGAAFTGAEGQFFQQALQQGVQAAGTDVFGFFVDLPSDFCDALDAVVGEADGLAFGSQQGDVLFG